MPSPVETFFEDIVPPLLARFVELEMEIEPLALPNDDAKLSVLEDLVLDVLKACRDLDEALGTDEDLRKSAQERFRQATAPW